MSAKYGLMQTSAAAMMDGISWNGLLPNKWTLSSTPSFERRSANLMDNGPSPHTTSLNSGTSFNISFMDSRTRSTPANSKSQPEKSAIFSSPDIPSCFLNSSPEMEGLNFSMSTPGGSTTIRSLLTPMSSMYVRSSVEITITLSAFG